MKKTIAKAMLALIVAALGTIQSAQAQKLVVWHKDGSKVTYDLEENPVTTFEGANLVIKTEKMSVSYPLTDVLRYTYEDVVSSVEQTPVNHGIIVRQEGNDMSFANLEAGALVQVYDTNGQLLSTQTVDGADAITLSFEEHPKGVYIVKVDDVTYKFLRK